VACVAINPGWDRDGLAGDIIEACVRYPPSSEGEVRQRAKWATVEWFRANLGRTGVARRSCSPPLHSASWSTRIPTSRSTCPTRSSGGFDVSSSAVDELVARLDKRSGMVLRMRMDGWSQHDIAELLGVTESRVGQLMTKAKWLLKHRLDGIAA
jgi:hypothetical protein